MLFELVLGENEDKFIYFTDKNLVETNILLTDFRKTYTITEEQIKEHELIQLNPSRGDSRRGPPPPPVKTGQKPGYSFYFKKGFKSF